MVFSVIEPPTTSPEGRGWFVAMIYDRVPGDAVGPLGSKRDAQTELDARSHDVVHGRVEPLLPRSKLPGVGRKNA
jgi:hypothetical protein